MEMEQGNNPSEIGQGGKLNGESQHTIELALQLAMQLRGDSKEKLESFFDEALRLINAMRDRIEPKQDHPRDAAYDEFVRTGKKDDLARFLDLREGSFQVPTELLFFSGKAANKPVKRVGLAADGVVMWSPKDHTDCSPEFGQWEPMESNYFLFKSRLLKDCYAARLNDIEAQLRAGATRTRS
jgi:hypothetical protein